MRFNSGLKGLMYHRLIYIYMGIGLCGLLMCCFSFVLLTADVIDNTNMYGSYRCKNCGKILERGFKSCIFFKLKAYS
jgi:hypothetical protein